MEENVKKQSFLCIEFHDKDGNIDPNLSRCPASPEMVVSALHFLSPDTDFVVSVRDTPVNFFEV